MLKKSLTEEMKDYQQSKKRVIPMLIVLGSIGLILPILPGIAILFLGFLLFSPRRGEKIIKKIRSIFRLDNEI